MKINFQKQFGKGTDPWYAKAERWVKKKFKNPYIQHLALGFVAWLKKIWIEGKILVFPAHLNHLVQENKSNEDRISVSFNIRLNSGRMKRRGRVSIPRWNFNWSEKK